MNRVSLNFMILCIPFMIISFSRTIKRLLQPGAATSDILQQYVSTIKVLRYLDPPGVLLYGVAEPIRRYLRCVERPHRNLLPFTYLMLPFCEQRKARHYQDHRDESDSSQEEEKGQRRHGRR